MPEPISSQVDAAASAPAAPSTPSPSTTPSTNHAGIAAVTATSLPASAPSTPSTSPAVSAPSAPVAPATPSWLSSLREKGVDLGSDEAGAIGRLAELHANYTRLAPVVPYVQQYMQHAPQFSKFLADQQKQAAPSPQGNEPFYAKYWSPPEYNPAWERMIIQDVNGNLVPVQGAPPDVVPKYLAYQQFRKDQAEKFLSNPHEYLKDTISHLAREEAQKIVQEQFGQVNTKSTVKEFMSQNSDWLFERDAAGNQAVVSQFNPHTGQYEQKPKLSQWGSAFTNYVKEASDYQARNGIAQDIEFQKDYAMTKVQRDFAVWKLNNPANGVATSTPTAPAVPVDPQQAANANFLRQNNPAAGIPASAGNSTPAPATGKRNLADMLRENFKRKGITDEVLINSN